LLPAFAALTAQSVIELPECFSLDGLSPEDRDRVAVDLAQQAADVR
jgi:hypothetical protein